MCIRLHERDFRKISLHLAYFNLINGADGRGQQLAIEALPLLRSNYGVKQLV